MSTWVEKSIDISIRWRFGLKRTHHVCPERHWRLVFCSYIPPGTAFLSSAVVLLMLELTFAKTHSSMKGVAVDFTGGRCLDLSQEKRKIVGMKLEI